MNFVSKNKFLLLVIVLAAFLRFYKLAEYPIQLGHDEVSQVYDAISIAETGKDIYGHPYPFIFQSVNDYKAPFYIYATAMAYKIFGWREITARVVGAFFGTLVVVGVYLFASEFLQLQKIALWAAFLTAISPFEIFYSRKSFENQSGVFLMLLGFSLLLAYLRKKKSKFIYWALITLGASMYVYFGQATTVPLLLFLFVLIFRKKLKAIGPRPFAVFLLIIAPLIYMVFVNPATRNRTSNVFITQDPRLDGELAKEKSGIAKAVTFGSFALNRYIKQFDPRYLFLEGLNFTEGKRDVGPLFVDTAPFLLLGIYLLLKQKDLGNERLFILAWILVGFVPSGLTFEDYSPHRAIAAFTMLNIVAAVGIYWFYKRFGKLALVILLIIFGANLAFFIKRYTVNYVIERSEALEYPFRDVSLFAWENHDKYAKIVFDPKFGEFTPRIGTGAQYYLGFYGHYPPAKMQKEFKIGDQTKRETTFDKFSIRAVFWPEDHSLKNTLIIASPWSLPPDIQKRANIIKTFYFETTAPAFYAIKL